ncbi:enhanced intracellular survival protein Eis [Ruania zhangjianzhongii]|uniref:GNAT family N-acetyltransferase n=1 Tax=Ruania zhangjianzhongii TaxID=2603206 RepID=UPI0011CA6324|nr:GNAT family N-acetyltransferase [Ruania zhangjianzhongii]
MAYRTRALTPADTDAARHLGREAFGMPDADRPDQDPPDGSPWPGPGSHALGTFAGAELAARAVALELGTWFAGRELRTCGIAGMTVAAEHRGRGLTHPLLTELLLAARDRGEVIATLFATAPGIYRRLGFEMITTVDQVQLPVSSAAAVPPGDPVRLRRATAADAPALRDCYRDWARVRQGPLTRTGAAEQVSDEDLIGDQDAVTLAVSEAGEILGYACWDRGTLSERTLTVTELVAHTPQAYRSLWRMAGAFAMKVDRVLLHAPAGDVARTFLPAKHWQVVAQEPYMLRVLDLPAALAARGSRGSGQVRITVAGDELGLVNGTFQITADGGELSCEPSAPAEGPPVLTAGGLSLAVSGAFSCADLRASGHLTGGDARTDRTLEDLLHAPPWQIRDTF